MKMKRRGKTTRGIILTNLLVDFREKLMRVLRDKAGQGEQTRDFFNNSYLWNDRRHANDLMKSVDGIPRDRRIEIRSW